MRMYWHQNEPTGNANRQGESVGGIEDSPRTNGSDDDSPSELSPGRSEISWEERSTLQRVFGIFCYALLVLIVACFFGILIFYAPFDPAVHSPKVELLDGVERLSETRKDDLDSLLSYPPSSEKFRDIVYNSMDDDFRPFAIQILEYRDNPMGVEYEERTTWYHPTPVRERVALIVGQFKKSKLNVRGFILKDLRELKEELIREKAVRLALRDLKNDNSDERGSETEYLDRAIEKSDEDIDYVERSLRAVLADRDVPN